MLCDHFGLRCLPFEDRADAQFTFATPEFEEALAAMEYETHYGKSAVLVAAEAGIGKTQLIRTLMLHLHSTDHAVVLTCPGGCDMHVVREACKGFGVTVAATHTADQRLFGRLRRHLQRTARAGHHSVLIVDQAENLDATQMSQLAQLSDTQGEDGRILSVICVGQPRVHSVLELPEFARLRQQVFNERRLNPLSAEQASGYIRHRLQVAGATHAEIFTPDAIELIGNASGGIPRIINQLCNAAMLAAYGAVENCITRALVAEIAQHRVSSARSIPLGELGLSAGSPAARELSESLLHGTSSASRNPPNPARTAAAAAPSDTPWNPTPPARTAVAYDAGDDDSNEPFDAASGDQTGYDAELPPTLIGPMESLFARGSVLVARLEQALSRADSLSGSADALANRVAAAERRLHEATSKAERSAETVEQELRRGASGYDDVRRRLDALLTAAEERLGRLDSASVRTSVASRSADEWLARVNDACERAERTEAQATAATKRLDDTTTNAKRELQQLRSGLQEAVELRRETQTACEEARSRCQAVEDAARRATETASDGRSTLETMKATWKTATATLQREFEAKLTEQHGRASAQLTEETAEAIKAVEQLRNAIQSAGQQKTAVLGVTADLAAQTGQVQSNLTAVQTTLQNLTATIATGQRLGEELKSTGSSVKESAGAAARRAGELIERLSADTSATAKLREELQSCARSLEQPVALARAAATDLNSRISQVDSHAAAAKSTVEALRSATISSREACEMLKPAEAVARRAAELTERLNTDASAATRLRDELQSCARSVEQPIALAQAAAKDLSSRIGQIDSHLAAAKSTVQALHSATVSGREACEMLKTAEKTARAAAQGSQTQLEQLQTVDAERTSALKRLEAACEIATTQSQRLNEILPETKQTRRALEEAWSAGEGVLKALVGAGTTTREAIEQATELSSALAQAEAASSRRHDEHQKELTALVERIEKGTAVVRAEADRATHVSSEAREATAKAETVVQRVEVSVAEATSRAASLAEKNESAKALEQTLLSITEMMDKAKGDEASVKRTVEEVRAVHEEFTAILDEIMQQCLSLHDLASASQELIKTQERIRTETEVTTRLWGDRVSKTQTAIESGRQTMEELVEQVKQLEQRTSQLDTTTQAMERSIAGVTSEPTAIIENIKAHSAHLDKVFNAVRKVSAGLSQAALDARTRTTELDKVGKDATGQLALLQTQTQDSMHMLHQWVTEALRAQERLESIMRNVPPTSQTHPRDALLGIAQALGSQVRRQTTTGSLHRLPDHPAPNDGAAAAPREVPRPRNRAEEVAKLLEEVCRSHGTAPATAKAPS